MEEYKAGAIVVAAAAARTTSALQPGAPAAKPVSKTPSWVEALLTLERTNSQPDKAEVMESRLAGDFKGWSGRTTFRLENGQIWGQANSDQYSYTPALKSPKVKLSPAAMGTFWLNIEGVNQRCRVKPVKLE